MSGFAPSAPMTSSTNSEEVTYTSIDKANKLTGDIIGEARDRVLNDEELKLLIEGIQCPDFNRFVRFAYYTGARSSEVRSLQREMLKDDYIIARGFGLISQCSIFLS